MACLPTRYFLASLFGSNRVLGRFPLSFVPLKIEPAMGRVRTSRHSCAIVYRPARDSQPDRSSKLREQDDEMDVNAAVAWMMSSSRCILSSMSHFTGIFRLSWPNASKAASFPMFLSARGRPAVTEARLAYVYASAGRNAVARLPKRVINGQQYNAHRCIAPGRDPGRGAAR